MDPIVGTADRPGGAPPELTQSDPPTLPTHDARTLVGDGARACILLDGTAYFLRITRAGKLILTK